MTENTENAENTEAIITALTSPSPDLSGLGWLWSEKDKTIYLTFKLIDFSSGPELKQPMEKSLVKPPEKVISYAQIGIGPLEHVPTSKQCEELVTKVIAYGIPGLDNRNIRTKAIPVRWEEYLIVFPEDGDSATAQFNPANN